MQLCAMCEKEFSGVVCESCEEKLISEIIAVKAKELHDCIACETILTLRREAAARFLAAVGQREWSL